MEYGDMIKEELVSILEIYYNGSFTELTCDYICHMGIIAWMVQGIYLPLCHKKFNKLLN